MAPRVVMVRFQIPPSISRWCPMEVSKNAKGAYEAFTTFIASSLNDTAIEEAAMDEEKWTDLACDLNTDRRAQYSRMLNEVKVSQDRTQAAQLETWLLIMAASAKLASLAAIIAMHRNARIVSTKDVEGAWDALGLLASRLPCAAVLAVGGLEAESDEGSDGSSDEEYDPLEESASDDDECSGDDDDDSVDDCDDDSDEGFEGGWSSEPEPCNPDQEEADEQEERSQASSCLAPEMSPQASHNDPDGTATEEEEKEKPQTCSYLAPEMISRLKANLVALGLSSDGTPSDLVGRLLEAIPSLPATSVPMAAPTAGVAASDSASRVEQEGSRRSAVSDGTEATRKASKRGYSALQHRKPLRDMENRGEVVDAVDGEGLLSASDGAAKKQKHTKTPMGGSVDNGHVP